MNTSALKAIFSLLILLGFLFVAACDEAPSVAPEDSELAYEQVPVLSKKPNCNLDPLPKGCKDEGGGGAEGPPMFADLTPDGNKLNELVIMQGTNDPRHNGGRLGTMWATGFGMEWDGIEFVSTAIRATAPNCPVGGTFGLLEANLKGGKVTTVWLRGNDGAGTTWSSDKIDVGSQLPDNGGWILEVRENIIVNIGKGQKKDKVCTVYVNDIIFSPVN